MRKKNCEWLLVVPLVMITWESDRVVVETISIVEKRVMKGWWFILREEKRGEVIVVSVMVAGKEEGCKRCI